MNELLVKQLTRQLKLLNFWVTIFGTLFLISFIIIGVLIFKLVTFVHDAEHKISDLQQKTSETLNVQKKVCDTKSVGNFLKDKTGTCR